MDPFLMRPVIAGMWRQEQTWNGDFVVDDLLDAHEILDLKAENDFRWHEWNEARQRG